jgi:hypothetical protein
VPGPLPVKPLVSQPKNTVSGPALLERLANTSGTVKLIRNGAAVKVTAPQALMLVRSGNYVGGGSLNRIRYIREVDSRSPMVADPSFWEGRGIIRWWADQRTGRGRVALDGLPA